MSRWRKRGLWALVILLFLGGAAWVVITPDNPFMRLFRLPITHVDARIITGPYPEEGDFIMLKKNGVTTIVTLLDPDLPYESVLLDREMALAKKYGMEMHNFPMISIFGSKFGANYDQNVAAATDAALQAKGKVYLHCYLGRHRVKSVESLLRSRQATTAKYALKEGERSADLALLDDAQAHYDGGRFSSALASLAGMKELDTPAKILKGWATYRTGDIPAARAVFVDALATTPNRVASLTGLGYCDLRLSDLPTAEKEFTTALTERPKDASCLAGLGMVLSRQGRNAEAAERLEAALKIDPANKEAQDILKRIKAKEGTTGGSGK